MAPSYQLLEIMFDNVPDHSLEKLTRLLIENQDDIELEYNDSGTFTINELESKFFQIFESKEEYNIINVRISFFYIGDMRINNAVIMIERFVNTQTLQWENNVIIVFDEKSFIIDDGQFMILKLHYQTKMIADRLNITEFYGGVEGCYYKENRFFSNSGFGPLTFIDSPCFSDFDPEFQIVSRFSAV